MFCPPPSYLKYPQFWVYSEMKPMSSIDKLDAVLKVLTANKRNQFYFSVVEATSVVSDLSEAQIILNKLIKDGYADKRELPETIDHLAFLSNPIYFITFEGKMFLESGGYKNERRKKWIIEFPKNYWWIIALIAFLIGFFGDISKEWLKQKILKPSQELKQVIPEEADTTLNHKIH
jgi:hypothetical protein